MSILSSIRQKVTSARQQQHHHQAAAYNDLVRRIADGEEPPAEELQAVLVEPVPVFRPTCPQSPNHTNIQVTHRTGNTRKCLCHDCGRQWEAEFDGPDAGEVQQPDGPDLEQLEKDVELLKQRRRWRELLDKLPELQQSEEKLQDRRQKEIDKVQRAIQRRDAVLQETGPELQRISAQKSEAERARRQLIETCMDPAIREKLREREEQRRTAAHRAKELKEDLWGAGPVGMLRDVYTNSTGGQMLKYQQQLVDLDTLLAEQPKDSFRGKQLLHDPSTPEWKRHRHAGRTKNEKEEIDKLEAEYRQWFAQIVRHRIEEFCQQSHRAEQLAGEINELQEQALSPL